MKFNSIRFKISVLYVAILGIILIIYSSFLYLSLHYTLYDELDGELDKKAQEIARAIDSYVEKYAGEQQDFISCARQVINTEEFPDPDEIDQLQRQWLQKVDNLGLKDDYIAFLDVKGKPLIKSANLQKELFSFAPKDINKLLNGEPISKSIKFEKRNIRAISTLFSYDGNEKYIIQVGASLKPVIHLLQVRLMHILVSIPVILLIAALFGRLFAVRILRPVVEITRTASKITHEDLTARVKAEHVDEEMKYLVGAFNDMISRLQQSFSYIAEFSSHVAHELKTPLAIIKGESDIALRKERDAQEYKRVIKVTLEETERMLKVIEGLLLLTKLDYRPESFNFEQFDLVEFLKEIYEQSRVLATQKEITVNIKLPASGIVINADRLHLRRLFFNLISNSIKFTNSGGRIDIAVMQTDKKAVITVSDTGIGIAGEDLPKIFDRFFHVDRTGKIIEPGTGLGLSIAKSIAAIHGGAIDAKSKPREGSAFTVTLPIL
ncbi:MAG: HAMP domain-containing protein [Candidatus Omnitrophica bacterium]|nr:HAMP domain-containing protein [Candidatus Omnitrophota bacterium]MBU4473468.1 HAMP domain-containing protein [Candidatus Omnitrophota bacterium]